MHFVVKHQITEEGNYQFDLQIYHVASTRVPKKEEIDQVFLLARVMYKAVLGLHFQRQQQQQNGQMAFF